MCTLTTPSLRQAGISIIDVLISIAVVSIGMLAMLKLQGQIIQGTGVANMRSVATSLAREKMDDLRAFECVVADTGAACAAYDATSHAYPSYFHETSGTDDEGIASDHGGARNQADGTLRLPASDALTLGNFTFQRHWVVPVYASAPAYKDVTIVISWGTAPTSTELQDADADRLPNICDPNYTGNRLDSISQTSGVVCLAGTIQGIDPYDIANKVASLSADLKPKVSYTPIGVPDVVPIDVTINLQKETSKPLPDVSSKSYSLRTEFDTVTYSGTSGDYKKEQLDEYVTLNCVCEFITDGPAYPASYFVWKDSELRVKYPTTTISKKRGIAPSITGDTQDILCGDCCRDHHDSELPSVDPASATTALYDKDRPTTDYQSASGNHKHYYYHDAAHPEQGLDVVPESAGNRYLESCRFLRVDGIFRLMQDWRLADVTVMPKDGYLVTGSTALSDYQTYVGTVAKAQAKTDGGTATTWDKSGLSVTRDKTNIAAGTPIQYLVRGIYVDRVYGEAAPRTLDSTYYSYLTAHISDTDILKNIPFNEVNMTLLASWRAHNSSVASVTNMMIRDINATDPDYYGVFSRGEVTLAVGSGGNSDITAYVLPSNSGLTGGVTRSTYTNAVDYNAGTLADTGTPIPYSSEIGMDRHDHASSGRRSDTVNISRSGSSSNQVTGHIRQGNASALVNDTAITVSASGGITCIVSIAGGTGSFTCPVASDYSGTITITSSQVNSFFDLAADSNGDTTYNDGGEADGFSSTCTVASVTGSVDCGLFWVFGPYVNVSGTCSDGGLGAGLCADAKVTVNADGTTPATSDVASCTKGTAPICNTLALDLTTKTWTGRIGVTSSQIGAGGKPSHWDADATCSDGETRATEVRYTGSITVGPADAQLAYTLCVSDN